MSRPLEPVIDDFFSNKSRAFWILQIGGWTAYAPLRFLSGLANQMGLEFVAPTLISTLTGFSLTLIMGTLFRMIIGLRQPVVWALSAVIVIIFAALFSAIEVWAVYTFFDPNWDLGGLRLLGAILVDLYVLTTWATLYFGINYYLILRAQSERILLLSAQAHAAQLKMLRYQLNPHFLFNTLNSISTLVMVGEQQRANAMLTRLASFLRYTLVGEATMMVTVDKEVEALKLYLEIEHMRFEERLQVHYDIAVEARGALLPSLLLQPLVENAIKYAVAPSETGARISLSARTVQDRLKLVLSDTGPGMGSSVVPSSSGVGLANIRDRLQQAYGEDHSIEITENMPHGVVVTITVPLQTKQDNREATG